MELNAAISDYASGIGYIPQKFIDLRCGCGSELFKLFSDDTEGGAYCICASCGKSEDIQNSQKYIEKAQQNICNCDAEHLQLGIGISYYPDSEDPRWVYIGCKCPDCGLAGVYVDWQER